MTYLDELFSLAGKTALVTGGARGLGRMIANGLSDAGARVFITSRHADTCHASASEIGAHALPGDAGTSAGIAAIATELRAAGVDRLHILVNNAGKTWGAPLETFPDKAWASVMEVNVQAPFRAVQALLPELTAAGTSNDPARVINIGSIAGITPLDLQAYSYTASKAAIHMLGRQMARDLIDRHINVNSLIPGFFPTKMTAHLRDDPTSEATSMPPMGRYGRPDEIAAAAIYLSSRASAYLTGTELTLDGGITGCG